MFGSLPVGILTAVKVQRATTEAHVHTRGSQLDALLGILLGLSWIFTGLRVYVRFLLTKNWAADDTVLILALVSYTLFFTFSAAGIAHGIGRHVKDIAPEQLPVALMFWWACELLYALTTLLLRVSLSIFLLRICVKKIQKRIIYVTMAIVGLFSTYFMFLVLFQCKPVNYFWNQYAGAEGSCIPPQWVPDSTLAHSAISATADWILGLMPVFLLKDLQMNLRTKLSVVGVMNLGILAGIAAIIRIPFIQVLAITDDFLFATVDVDIWSAIEPGIGIIAAASIALRPLFKKFYGLSSNGATIHPTKHASTGRQTHITQSRENLAADFRFQDFDHDVMEMGAAASTIIINRNRIDDEKSRPKGGRQQSTRSSITTEDKGLAWNVQVRKTIEISRRDRTSKDSGKNLNPDLGQPWSGGKI